MQSSKHKRAAVENPLLGERQTQNLVKLVTEFGKSLGLDTTGFMPDRLVFGTARLDGDVSRFRDEYLLSEILSKYPFEVPGVDRATVALAKFHECESQCSLTNDTVGTDTRGPDGLSWHAVLFTASRKISSLLGPLNWSEVEAHCNFGPGASTSRPRSGSDAFYKFGSKPDVTPDCALLAWNLVRSQPAWWRSLTGVLPREHWLEDYSGHPPEEIFRYVPGNRITTVPKNAKTDRVIAIEPDMNMYVQKGLGAVIRSRLRSAGINLNDQTRNQRLAREGSLTGALATVDFSSASDTICLRIVEELLPPDWAVGLKQTRSPVGVLPDKSFISYEKISSMGNGYTFELESLIFWALACSVRDLLGLRGIVSVYGDDLVVEAAMEEPLKWAFARAGFTLNEKKSFFDGPFRESCGKHYFRGDDVTPFYVRKRLTTVWDLYSLANNVRRWARLHWGLDGRAEEFYRAIVSCVPPHLRFKIPEGLGDVGLVSDFDEAAPSFDRSLQMLRCKSYHPRVASLVVEGNALLSKWFHLRGTGHAAPDIKYGVERIQRTIPSRGYVERLHVREWPSFGPFLS